MQVRFRRGKQTGGMFGGKESFAVQAVIMPSPEERALMDKHQRWKRTVFIQTEDGDEPVSFCASWAELIQGYAFAHRNMNVIFYTEDEIIRACKTECASLEALESFEGGGAGEAVFDVNRHEHKLVATD